MEQSSAKMKFIYPEKNKQITKKQKHLDIKKRIYFSTN